MDANATGPQPQRCLSGWLSGYRQRLQAALDSLRSNAAPPTVARRLRAVRSAVASFQRAAAADPEFLAQLDAQHRIWGEITTAEHELRQYMRQILPELVRDQEELQQRRQTLLRYDQASRSRHQGQLRRRI